jgi:hypothetical protein
MVWLAGDGSDRGGGRVSGVGARDRLDAKAVETQILLVARSIADLRAESARKVSAADTLPRTLVARGASARGALDSASMRHAHIALSVVHVAQ